MVVSGHAALRSVRTRLSRTSLRYSIGGTRNARLKPSCSARTLSETSLASPAGRPRSFRFVLDQVDCSAHRTWRCRPLGLAECLAVVVRLGEQQTGDDQILQVTGGERVARPFPCRLRLIRVRGPFDERVAAELVFMVAVELLGLEIDMLVLDLRDLTEFSAVDTRAILRISDDLAAADVGLSLWARTAWSNAPSTRRVSVRCSRCTPPTLDGALGVS